MTKYIVFSVIVTALIYFNVFGLYMGIKDIPKGSYKEALWKERNLSVPRWDHHFHVLYRRDCGDYSYRHGVHGSTGISVCALCP